MPFTRSSSLTRSTSALHMSSRPSMSLRLRTSAPRTPSTRSTSCSMPRTHRTRRSPRVSSSCAVRHTRATRRTHTRSSRRSASNRRTARCFPSSHTTTFRSTRSTPSIRNTPSTGTLHGTPTDTMSPAVPAAEERAVREAAPTSSAGRRRAEWPGCLSVPRREVQRAAWAAQALALIPPALAPPAPAPPAPSPPLVRAQTRAQAQASVRALGRALPQVSRDAPKCPGIPRRKWFTVFLRPLSMGMRTPRSIPASLTRRRHTTCRAASTAAQPRPAASRPLHPRATTAAGTSERRRSRRPCTSAVPTEWRRGPAGAEIWAL